MRWEKIYLVLEKFLLGSFYRELGKSGSVCTPRSCLGNLPRFSLPFRSTYRQSRECQCVNIQQSSLNCSRTCFELILPYTAFYYQASRKYTKICIIFQVFSQTLPKLASYRGNTLIQHFSILFERLVLLQERLSVDSPYRGPFLDVLRPYYHKVTYLNKPEVENERINTFLIQYLP